MTTPTSPKPETQDEPSDIVTLDGVAVLADIGARLLELAARTGLAIGTMPAGDRYDEVQQAMERATEAAQDAAALVVELSRTSAI